MTSQLDARIFSYDLPTILFSSKNVAWTKSNVVVSIEGDASITQKFAVVNGKLLMTGLSSMVDNLNSSSKVLNQTYEVYFKTSVKPYPVDGIDYGLSKWTNCYFYQKM